jgi:SAM-dependent methyltransferase
VDAVDLSPVAVAWAEDRAREAGVDIRFLCGEAFALPDADLSGPYDLVVDSGCFHHLPPHRRVSYLTLLDRVLAPGGHLALACFAAGAMGSELAETDLYRGRGLQRMRDEPPESALFGEDFLWTALFRRDAEATPDEQ